LSFVSHFIPPFSPHSQMMVTLYNDLKKKYWKENPFLFITISAINLALRPLNVGELSLLLSSSVLQVCFNLPNNHAAVTITSFLHHFLPHYWIVPISRYLIIVT
jgi:hypothetical protein